MVTIPPMITSGPVFQSKAEKIKYIDDGTVAVSIDMRKCLIDDPVARPRPLNLHERTSHILPSENNLLQYYLDDTEQFTKDNMMKINGKKTKVILLNKSRKWDFPPEVSFSDKTNLEVVPVIKLVGVMISSDLKWNENTNYICEKAMGRMWILRRMRVFNLNLETIWDTYVKEIRSILELAVPVWHGGLTKKQTRDIERVQKVALLLILGENYVDYDVACTIMGVEPLCIRREELCLKFARKNIKQENTLFHKVTQLSNTRSKEKVVIEPGHNTKRYKNSSIPYLSRLLNSNV